MRTTLENVILISIKPEHAVNILNGKKKLELRKTAPKDFEGYEGLKKKNVKRNVCVIL